VEGLKMAMDFVNKAAGILLPVKDLNRICNELMYFCNSRAYGHIAVTYPFARRGMGRGDLSCHDRFVRL
jgi:hypothetical protein